MKIRKAEIKDFLEIAKLDRSAWGKNENATFVPDGEHAWRIWIEYSLVYCAENNNKIIGVILAFPTIHQNLYFLHKIFIDYNYRNQQIGNRLFNKLCKKLDENQLDCSLTTAPDNNAMKKLCQKFNFNDVTLIKSYYRTEEDRLLYSRKFIVNKR